MTGVDKQNSLSSDSLAYLEETKKGKSRRFVLIAKGTQIVSLVVYKKGSLEKLKKEAKEGGKGQFYHGVIEGKGMHQSFMLSVEDGFTEAPVKNSILKGFLSENGFTCKPEFQIVPQLPEIADEEGDGALLDGSMQEQKSPSSEHESQRSNSASQGPPASQLHEVGMEAGSHDLSQWQAKRELAVQSLRELAKAIAATKDPDSSKAIIEIRAVISNLTLAPTTKSQINDLRRYLEGDDVVQDVCDFAFDFRDDLLGALPELSFS